MLDDSGPLGDPGDDPTLCDPGTASGLDADDGDFGIGTAGGGSNGKSSMFATSFAWMAAELAGLDIELPLVGTSRNSGSDADGESDDDDGLSASGSVSGSDDDSYSGTVRSAHEKRCDRRFDVDVRCSPYISKIAASSICSSGFSVCRIVVAKSQESIVPWSVPPRAARRSCRCVNGGRSFKIAPTR